MKSPEGTEERFLRHIFRVSIVAQDAASNAKSEWDRLGQQHFELTPKSRYFRLAARFSVQRNSWLDQDQLLHAISQKAEAPMTRFCSGNTDETLNRGSFARRQAGFLGSPKTTGTWLWKRRKIAANN
jgi:hypothetical protein